MKKVLLSAASVRGVVQVGTRVRAALTLCVGLLLGVGVLSAGSAFAAPSASDTCPNAAIRAEQHAAFLSDCRAYEMVSPVEKGGVNVNVQSTVQTNPAGDLALFTAPTGFPGAPTSTASNYYLASRAGDRWGTDPIEPEQNNLAKFLTYTSVATSRDLSRSLQVSSVALTPGAVEGGGNIYLRDNRTGQRTLVATGPYSMLDGFVGLGALAIEAATPDFSHVVFHSAAKLTDGAIEGVVSAYDFSVSGGLRLVGILPDGTSDSAGATAQLRGDVLTHGHPAISDDGKRIVFAAGTTGGLFLREGDSTIPISVSQRAGDPNTPRGAKFVSMTADGSQVFLLSEEALTDDSVASLSGAHLYRYDVGSGRLTDLSVPADPADPGYVSRVLSVTDSGDRVYFVANMNLAAGGVSGAQNLYLWTPAGTTFVAALDPNFEYNVGPPTWATSPSGRFLAFASVASIAGYDNHDAACPEPAQFQGPPAGTCTEIYVYDADTHSIACPSCDAVVAGHSTIGAQTPQEGVPVRIHLGRAVTDDGRVFFESSARLAGSDTNGKIDVYEGGGDAARLISTGKSSRDSFFADASADGSSVFFATAEPLVGQDGDANIDLYAARVDGGLAGQNVVADPVLACMEDSCQGVPSPSAGRLVAGSVTFLGSGNVGPAPGSARAKVSGPKVTTLKAVTRASARLMVKVPEEGRIRVSGSGLATSSRTATRAGTYAVVVRLSRRGQQTLKRKHHLTVRVAVRFAPSEGKAQSVGISVTFKAAAASGKKGRS